MIMLKEIVVTSILFLYEKMVLVYILDIFREFQNISFFSNGVGGGGYGFWPFAENWRRKDS